MRCNACPAGQVRLRNHDFFHVIVYVHLICGNDEAKSLYLPEKIGFYETAKTLFY